MITILGPTACGKTTLAVAVARALDGDIISADSRQVYRGMDIGTGKDLSEYAEGGTPVPYHLIDIAEPGTKYNLFEYQRDFHIIYNRLQEQRRPVVLCGGTGLYLEAVIKGYALSPVPQNDALREELASRSLAELTEMLKELKRRNGSVMHNTTDVDTAQRAIRAIEIEQYNLECPQARRVFPAVSTTIIGLSVDRDERRRRISQRLDARLSGGMVEEIRSLLDRGIAAEDLMYYGLEYKYVTEYVIGKTCYQEMHDRLEIAIHQFAKRQMTWFRGMERRGLSIHWIDGQQPLEEKVKTVLALANEQHKNCEHER